MKIRVEGLPVARGTLKRACPTVRNESAHAHALPRFGHFRRRRELISSIARLPHLVHSCFEITPALKSLRLCNHSWALLNHVFALDDAIHPLTVRSLGASHHRPSWFQVRSLPSPHRPTPSPYLRYSPGPLKQVPAETSMRMVPRVSMRMKKHG